MSTRVEPDLPAQDDDEPEPQPICTDCYDRPAAPGSDLCHLCEIARLQAHRHGWKEDA